MTDASFLIQRGFDFRKLPEPRKKRYIFTLVGSSRFGREHTEAMARLTMIGCIVIPMGRLGHVDGMDMAGPEKAFVDLVHMDKIDISDGIFVVNPGRYIGESSRREIVYAIAQGKDVIYLEVPRDTSELMSGMTL